jgi:signal transduction histidine kinase/FixJ family two-component response regulator
MTIKGLPATLLRSQGYAVFEYPEGGVFRAIGRLPSWFENLSGQGDTSRARLRLSERFPFVANFLIDAKRVWRSKSGTWVKSGIWIERGADGREIPLECSAFSFQGRKILVILSPQGHFEETRRTLQTARELRLQYDSFLRDVQKKEILLHCIIHDLSQPLTAMRGCFSGLRRVKLPRDLQELVQIGERQSREQEAMIREIVEAFAAELSAPQAFHPGADEAPDLASCAMEVVRDFSAAFAEQDVRLELDPNLDLNCPWRVVGDASRLRRIYSNLVENALRHSPPGSTVTVGVADEGRCLRAFVDDRGVGLPRGQTASQLFRLFSKGKERGGKAGVGLYFCRITVERWGGTVGCESRSGGGARFWFQLPRLEPQPAIPEDVTSPKVAPSGDIKKSDLPRGTHEPAANRRPPLRILLAEDTAVIRKVATHMLRERGHKVVAVRNGREALDKLQQQEFDVVLMDAEMPKVNGIDATRAIRQQEKDTGGHLPVVAMTAYASEAERNRCLSAGMDSCLAKPFGPEELCHSVENLFINPAKTRRPRQVEPTSAQTRHAALLARVGGKAQLLGSLVRLFLTDCPKRLAGIRRAIARREGMMLASAAHALRGPVGLFFGDDETASITRKLETMGHRGDLAGATEAYTDLQRRLSRLCDDLRRFEGVRDERGSGQRAKASSGLEVKETERSKSQSTRSLSDGTQASGSKRGGRTARIRFIKSRKQPNLGG